MPLVLRREMIDIRESVRESILQVAAPKTDKAAQSILGVPQASAKSDNSSDSEEIVASAGFDFSRIEPFVKYLKEAISWEEPKEAPCKARKYFPNLKKDP